MSEPAQQDAAIVEHLNHEPFVRGTMPIHEQTATFESVFDKGLVRLGSLGVGCMVLFLVLAFCTSTGFFPALVIAVILAIIGAVVLRKAPSSDHTL